MVAPVKDSLVWHYTNASGLIGMVEGKQLWATHYQFMNDKLEGAVLERAILKLMEGDDLNSADRSLIAETYRSYDGIAKYRISRVPDGNRFLLCGSKSGDELTLWRNYARDEISFAVGLDPSIPLGAIPPKKHSDSTAEVTSWRAVDYQPESSTLPEEWLSRIRTELEQDDMGDRIVGVSAALLDVFCVVKSEAFEDERETRVVCIADNPRLWRFRSGNYGVTPYVALGATDSWGENSTGEEPLPIREIRLSSNSSDADRLAVNGLLESNGFGGGLEVEEGRDNFGRPVLGDYREIEPPVLISKASNSLRL